MFNLFCFPSSYLIFIYFNGRFLDFYRMFLDVLILIDLIVILFLTVLFIFIFMLPFGHYFLSFTVNVSTIYIFVCFYSSDLYNHGHTTYDHFMLVFSSLL